MPIFSKTWNNVDWGMRATRTHTIQKRKQAVHVGYASERQLELELLLKGAKKLLRSTSGHIQTI